MEYTIFDCPLFSKYYEYKIYMLGFFQIKNVTKKGTLIAYDIFLKSHEYYYKLSIDMTTIDSKDTIPIKIKCYENFEYLNLPNKVIVVDDYGTSLKNVVYKVYEDKQEVLFDNIEIDSINDFTIKSNLFTVSLHKSAGWTMIDKSNTIDLSRNMFIYKLFDCTEAKKNIDFLKKNDDYQLEYFEKEKNKQK